MNLQLDSAVVEVESDEALVTESLKNLYIALGGDESDIANAESTLDVLNILSVKYGGEDNAESIPDAIDNITAVAGNIGGGSEPNSIVFTDVQLGSTKVSDVVRDITKIQSVTIPDSVTSIQYSAFSGCTGLTEITIPDSVTSIGKAAFNGCSGLTSITIPDNVTSIGTYAFNGCSGLTTITINKPENSIDGAPWGAPNATVVWTG